jgi:hypothetical protein
MRKIAALVKKGWQVEITSDSQGWFQVGFFHNSWGDIDAHAEVLSEAINKAYEKVIALEQY